MQASPSVTSGHGPRCVMNGESRKQIRAMSAGTGLSSYASGMGLPWWPWVPDECVNGHELAPGKVTLTWEHCDCPAAEGGGHQVVYCGKGCRPPARPPGHVGPDRDQR